MSSLDQFLKPIEIHGESLEQQYLAYKMDEPANQSSMRKFAGLGECNCCDYLYLQGETAVFIEETQLKRKKEDIENSHKYLNDQDKKDIVKKRISEEMRLKAYGSMLVLCRLMSKLQNERNLAQVKKYDFWLVASSIGTETSKAFDNLKTLFLDMLKGALGEVVNNVEFLDPETLKKRLSKP